jgi:pimeloyl-ACP methyl ester carboxylesterase
MTMLGARLSAAGFEVANVGYPSTRESLEELVLRLQREVEACCPSGTENLHFVTHSMGGILVRRYLARYSPQHRGRVVMLSPPSQGSEIIDAFTESPLLLEMLGPMGAQLGTDSLSLPNQLGPADFELGIIAGNRSLNIITSWLFPGPDDGQVSVERARLEGAAHFLVVPATHTFIMNRRDVADQTAFFLRNGRFSADSLAAEETDSSEVMP